MSIISNNPQLRFIKQDWFGNPTNVDENEYVNLDSKSERTFWDVLKWKFQKNTFKPLKKNQKPGIEIISDEAFLQKNIDGITWLGHTSFLLDLSGHRILTDPVLESTFFNKKHTPLPCSADKLQNIDYILLSHFHPDHADEDSVLLLCEQNPNAQILCGLQASELLRNWGVQNNIIEAGWFQNFGVSENFEIHFLPAKHWSRMGLSDQNTKLWGSFMFYDKILDKKIFFGGDSGYGVHFKMIGELYGHIDYALIGIGAYEPIWFMHHSHAGPNDTLQIKEDLNAEFIIPMHYGTFDLSNEPIFYPPQKLKELLKDHPEKDKFLFRNIGGKLKV
ncbi:MAG: MBL fold metallo-hydrolase [Cytophagales bacterium]